MARVSFFKLSRGLGLLIFLISAFARAQDVDCANIRSCSAVYHVYEVAAHACRAQMSKDGCASANRNTEWGQYLKDCSPESMCREAKLYGVPKSAVLGCTKNARDFGSAVVGGLQVCRDAGWIGCPVLYFGTALPQTIIAAAKGVFYTPLKEVYDMAVGNTMSVSDAQAMIDKGHKCFNYEGSFRLECDRIGGTFVRAAMLHSLANGMRGAISAVAVEDVAVVARRARVVERAQSSTGAPKPRPAIIAETRRRANASVAATAVTAAADADQKKKTQAAQVARRQAAARAVAVTERDEYIRRLVGRQNTTVAERQAFAELAARATSDGRTIFVDIQNSKMKYLNDHLGDKNVVTAITNRRMELAFEKLEELKAKYPQMVALKYEDFKSARFALQFADHIVPAGFMNDLKQIFATADREFVEELVAKNIIANEALLDVAKTSTATGIGPTANAANVGARAAKRTGAAVVDTSRTSVRANLQGRLRQTETLRTVLTPWSSRPKLVKKLGNGELVPSLEVMEAFRKAENAADLRTAIAKRTGETISAQSAQSLFNYLKQLDEWSPGLLLVEERQSVSFVGSRFNGVTIDVSGMGALNMQQLAEKLAGVKEVTPAMERAAASGDDATRIFLRNKQAIVDSAKASLEARGYQVDIKVSGDDIIIMPTTTALDSNALAAVQDAVARSSSSSNVRLSAVAPGAATADNLAVAGELLEKEVRSRTMTSVPAQNNYNLMVVTDASGQATLRVSARTSEVPDSVRAAFEAAFAAAKTP